MTRPRRRTSTSPTPASESLSIATTLSLTIDLAGSGPSSSATRTMIFPGSTVSWTLRRPSRATTAPKSSDSPPTYQRMRRRRGIGVLAVVLFGVTAMSHTTATRKQCLGDFTKVLDTVPAGGVIAADIIDDNPLAHSTYPINESFDRYNPLKENKLDYERRIREKLDAVIKAAEGIVRRPLSGRWGTSVRDAMQLAERAFAAFGGDQKLLVVFSSMIEQSRRYDFTGENLTAARIGQIIARELAAQRLPDLQGVEVCVVGAGATGPGGPSTEKLLSIRNFWLQYFKAAGANLPPAPYGSAFLKCPSEWLLIFSLLVI